MFCAHVCRHLAGPLQLLGPCKLACCSFDEAGVIALVLPRCGYEISSRRSVKQSPLRLGSLRYRRPRPRLSSIPPHQIPPLFDAVTSYPASLRCHHIRSHLSWMPPHQIPPLLDAASVSRLSTIQTPIDLSNEWQFVNSEVIVPALGAINRQAGVLCQMSICIKWKCRSSFFARITNDFATSTNDLESVSFVLIFVSVFSLFDVTGSTYTKQFHE